MAAYQGGPARSMHVVYVGSITITISGWMLMVTLSVLRLPFNVRRCC